MGVLQRRGDLGERLRVSRNGLPDGEAVFPRPGPALVGVVTPPWACGRRRSAGRSPRPGPHPVGDPRDGLFGHRRPMISAKWAEISPVVRPLGVQGQDDLVHLALAFRDHLGFERPSPIPRHVDLHRAGVGRQDRLGPRPVADVVGADPGRRLLLGHIIHCCSHGSVPFLAERSAQSVRPQTPLGGQSHLPGTLPAWGLDQVGRAWGDHSTARACRTALVTASRTFRPSSSATSTVEVPGRRPSISMRRDLPVQRAMA